MEKVDMESGVVGCGVQGGRADVEGKGGVVQLIG